MKISTKQRKTIIQHYNIVKSKQAIKIKKECYETKNSRKNKQIGRHEMGTHNTGKKIKGKKGKITEDLALSHRIRKGQ